MKAQQVWEMDVDELVRKEQELYDQIFKLRFQLATGQMDNPLKMREVRKDLARVKTVLRAKEVSATPQEPPTPEVAEQTGKATEAQENTVPSGEES